MAAGIIGGALASQLAGAAANQAGAIGVELISEITPSRVKSAGKKCGRFLGGLLSQIANDDDSPVNPSTATDCAQFAISFNSVAVVVGGRMVLPEKATEWSRLTRGEARERLISAMQSLQTNKEKFVKELMGKHKDAAVAGAAGRLAESGRGSLFRDLVTDVSFGTDPQKPAEEQQSSKMKGISGSGALLGAMDALLDPELGVGIEKRSDSFTSTIPITAVTFCSSPGTGVPLAGVGSVANLNVDGEDMGADGTPERQAWAEENQRAFNLLDRAKGEPGKISVTLVGGIDMFEVGGRLWNATELVDSGRLETLMKGTVQVSNSEPEPGEPATAVASFGTIQFPKPQSVTQTSNTDVRVSLELRTSVFMSAKGPAVGDNKPKSWYKTVKPVSAIAVVCTTKGKQSGLSDKLTGSERSLRASVVGIVPFRLTAKHSAPGFDATTVSEFDYMNYQTFMYTATVNFSAEMPADNSLFVVTLLNPSSPVVNGTDGLYYNAAGDRRYAPEIPNFVAPPGLMITPRTSDRQFPSMRTYTREGANGLVTDSTAGWTQFLKPASTGRIAYMGKQEDGSHRWKELNQSLASIVGQYQLDGVALNGEGEARASIGIGTAREVLISIQPKEQLWDEFATYASKTLNIALPRSFLEFASEYADEETVGKLREILLSGAAWVRK
uniref:Uncharacterized protein n=1 Tax=viral metagenome TaxID=1070528 RepID=A0A2V0RAI0_9ZZZZ